MGKGKERTRWEETMKMMRMVKRGRGRKLRKMARRKKKMMMRRMMMTMTMLMIGLLVP
jgi:hypothetical protein